MCSSRRLILLARTTPGKRESACSAPTAHSPPPASHPRPASPGDHLNFAYRRGCNKHQRAALVDWAQDTPRANAWARDTNNRSRDRGCGHPHAARILARAGPESSGAAGTTTRPTYTDGSARTLDAFATHLRHQLDVNAVANDLRSAVHETWQPAHVSLWLRS